MVTSGSPEFPAVHCGDEICPSGQLCVHQSGDCHLVEMPPCEQPGTTIDLTDTTHASATTETSSTTGTSDTVGTTGTTDTSGTSGTTDATGTNDTSGTADPGSIKCWDYRSTHTCKPIPLVCITATSQQALADCILDQNFCPYDPSNQGYFEDGELACPTEHLCWEGGDYQYGYCNFDCF